MVAAENSILAAAVGELAAEHYHNNIHHPDNDFLVIGLDICKADGRRRRRRRMPPRPRGRHGQSPWFMVLLFSLSLFVP